MGTTFITILMIIASIILIFAIIGVFVELWKVSKYSITKYQKAKRYPLYQREHNYKILGKAYTIMYCPAHTRWLHNLSIIKRIPILGYRKPHKIIFHTLKKVKE